MSIHVTDFKWEKGKNDLQYIELLEKTLKNEQAITAKAVAKIRELSKENKESRNKAIDAFVEKIIELNNEFPTVEDEWGELRPMTIEEMCNQVAEQLKGGAE